MTERQSPKRLPKPHWLKKSLPRGALQERVRTLISEECLHTVCREAKCPNMWNCYASGTATFLIMGPLCTRNCRFCSIGSSPVSPPDPEEPKRVAAAARDMSLSYVVITSVTRDDLTDGGASFFARTIREVRKCLPMSPIEILIPDFQGKAPALARVVNSAPDVINHNIETVPRLYPGVRPGAGYERSLTILDSIKKTGGGIITKSGLMLGLGETREEIISTMKDMRDCGCDIITMGQYLQPTAENLEVSRYIPPEEFDELRDTALSLGFLGVASGPFVRSSYRAHELFEEVRSVKSP